MSKSKNCNYAPHTLNIAAYSARSIYHAALICVVALSTLLGSGNAIAAQPVIVGSDVFTGAGLLLRTAIDTGGDDLLSVSDTGGDSTSLTGGSGTSFEIGTRLDLRLFERPAFETELTLGYRTSSLEVGSGTAEFTHTTVALSQFYRFKTGVRLGAGIGIRLASSLDVDLRGFEQTSTNLGTAPEYRFMLEYGFARKYAIGGRVLISEWESDGVTVDGGSAGVYVSIGTR